ncbi:glutamate--tRNA ligase [Sphingomonas sp. PL-96]|uniref:glutamate--tRNA ligase n=1 Tax=Sphingomonas sp. PL-96 TaxID=2887201 RepID=UPI001E4D9C1A|nr:glutamate--tRNA ligase [Sphingomonas sp. PL-96]MCC2977614.1 glutamate--tRNA ligase [Sphingomonas sp. PL-96]
MTVTTRFAPSPTGRLHLGNLRAALINWLHAKANGGRLLLRIDDTDAARSEERFVDAIRADLAWLGIDVAGEERQSARFGRYEACFADLVAGGRIYAAYETPEELDLRRKVLLGRGLPPVYDRAALALTEADRARLEAEGRRPHWRFRLDHDAPIGWHDLVRGEQRFEAARLSDPVVRRADGSWLYLLPSVIDDIDMGVTTVIRGEDHVSNTATQIQMFESLGAALPEFAHVALLTGAEGKLSKRLGATGVDEFRAMGIEPEAVVAMLARLGTSDPVEPLVDRATLIAGFDFARFGRAPARFDEGELQALNARIVHQLDWERVRADLPVGLDRNGWEAIRANLSTVAEAADWWQVVTGPVAAPALPDEDRAFVAQAAEVAEAIDWPDRAWAALTGALKQASGRKGKALFLPLRLALTGREHGPDMATLLPLIGREQAVARLRDAG